jgi:hypothetical protein
VVRVISRRNGETIEVLDTELNVVRTFPVPARRGFRQAGLESHAVTSTRDGLVYATDAAVIRIGPDGEMWRFDLGVGQDNARTDVAFSTDDTLIWVYVPNIYAGRGGDDEWIVLDAATGAVRSRRPLPSQGHGGGQFPLRDGRMLLDVGEGQDGSQIYLAATDSEIHDFGWGDRVLIDVSPDQTQFMTVDHERGDAAFHDFPSGAVRFRITMTEVEVEDPFENASVEWTGGYLDGDTAIMVVTGENEDTEETWWRHFTVDLRAGRVTGELGVTTIDEYDLRPLGDGTYVITDTDGTLRLM